MECGRKQGLEERRGEKVLLAVFDKIATRQKKTDCNFLGGPLTNVFPVEIH